jgi:hypothetical protein
MAKFAILMYEDDRAWSRLPAAERDRLMALYLAYVKDLRDRGAFLGGEPIGRGGRVLERPSGEPAGEIRESAFMQETSVLTGFFLVEAPDLEAATTIARDCPALLHGESVIVRPVGHEE